MYRVLMAEEAITPIMCTFRYQLKGLSGSWGREILDMLLYVIMMLAVAVAEQRS